MAARNPADKDNMTNDCSSPLNTHLNSSTSAYGQWPSLEQLNGEQVQFRMPAVGFSVVLMTVGILGNSLTMFVYQFRLKMSPINVLLFAIATLDLSTCLLCIPSEIANMLHPLTYNSATACKLSVCTCYILIGTCTGILTVLSALRYRMICRPQSRKVTVTRARLLTVVVAVVSVVLTSPAFHIIGITTIGTRLPNLNGTTCLISERAKHSLASMVYMAFLFLLNVLVFFTLTGYYVLLCLKVRRHRRLGWCGSQDIGTEQNEPGASPTPATLDRTTVTVLRILCLYTVSSFPTFTLLLAQLITGYEHSAPPPVKILHHIFLHSYFLNSCANPFIYGYSNNQFRKEIARLFTKP